MSKIVWLKTIHCIETMYLRVKFLEDAVEPAAVDGERGAGDVAGQGA